MKHKKLFAYSLSVVAALTLFVAAFAQSTGATYTLITTVPIPADSAGKLLTAWDITWVDPASVRCWLTGACCRGRNGLAAWIGDSWVEDSRPLLSGGVLGLFFRRPFALCGFVSHGRRLQSFGQCLVATVFPLHGFGVGVKVLQALTTSCRSSSDSSVMPPSYHRAV
jgi:hypothetical protein